MQNLDWLSDALGDFEDDYVRRSFPTTSSSSPSADSLSAQLIIDCPGQIELYTHIPILPRLAKLLTSTMNINLVACYLLESQFMEDTSKYFSGVLSAMSCMIGLEVPFVNVMSKMDLVRREGKRKKEVDRCVRLVLPFQSPAKAASALLPLSSGSRSTRRSRCFSHAASSTRIPSCCARLSTASSTPSSTSSTAPSCISCVVSAPLHSV